MSVSPAQRTVPEQLGEEQEGVEEGEEGKEGAKDCLAVSCHPKLESAALVILGLMQRRREKRRGRTEYRQGVPSRHASTIFSGLAHLEVTG